MSAIHEITFGTKNMTEPLLKIENLQTQLGEEQNPVRVVDGLDLTIHRGETFALLGESGCGKSMTALSMMRLLPETMAVEMAAHAERAAPKEACGLVAVDGGGAGVEVYPVENHAKGLDAYTIDPADLFSVIVDTERRGWAIGAVYHSHPSGPSHPSRTDLRSAFDPEWLSLIVSPEGDGWIVRAFRVQSGEATSVDLERPGPGYPDVVPRPSTT